MAAGEDRDIRLIGEQSVDPGPEKGDLLVDRPPVGGWLSGAGGSGGLRDQAVGGQEGVLGPEGPRVQQQPGVVGVSDQRGNNCSAVRMVECVFVHSGEFFRCRVWG